MSRVKRGKAHLKHRKNIIAQAKGYLWGRNNLLKLAKVAITKAGAYARRDRRQKKRDFKALWNIKINAGLFDRAIGYSKFLGGLRKQSIALNRKILAELAEKHEWVFSKLVDKVGK